MNVKVGDKFPDETLLNQDGHERAIAHYTRPSEFDKRLGFNDGYPLIIVFFRGFFCPRDQQQLRMLKDFQDELKVNFGRLISISTDPPMVNSAFRAGLGASWPFFSDENRFLINQLGILDETEGEYADRSLPITFVCNPDLTIKRIYNGWFFVGRPTLEELRTDLRMIMSEQSYYPHEVWKTGERMKIRVPQSYWKKESALGESGLKVSEGEVITFNFNSGNGYIKDSSSGERLFFNFTAIPGEGYRTISPGVKVQFEIIESSTGKSALNIQKIT
ncbi:MAG: cold shock domain-containing protein [Bacteroidota bacterium]